MNRKKLLAGLLLVIVAIPCMAQGDDFGIWTSADFKKKLFTGFNVTVGGEFRTRDDSKKVERWSGTLGVDYTLLKWMKWDAGYTYLYNNVAGRTTSKGNYVSPYWISRDRFYTSLEGEVNLGRFVVSLRERYQYTYRHSKAVAKYNDDGERKSADEQITGKGKNVLRTRPMIEYDIRKSAFKPYLSWEFYNSLNDKGAIDKYRLKVGTALKLTKRQAFDFYYLFQNHADDDEPQGHVLGLGYTYKFK